MAKQFLGKPNELSYSSWCCPNAASGRNQIRNSKSEIRNKSKTENPNDQDSSHGTPRVAKARIVIHYAKESIREAAAMPSVRQRLFVLNILALSFGFVLDFVLRIWDFERCAHHAPISQRKTLVGRRRAVQLDDHVGRTFLPGGPKRSTATFYQRLHGYRALEESTSDDLFWLHIVHRTPPIGSC